jgi:hypothetical protein
MSGLRCFFANLVVLGWMSNSQCNAQGQFTSCFNQAFVACTSNRCRTRTSLSATISACTKVLGEPRVRRCTSNAILRCATQPGAKSRFMCSTAVSNYRKNTGSPRVKQACLAMKKPCQTLMSCSACGRNDCSGSIALAPTNPPTFSPLQVAGNPGTPAAADACTTEECRARAACCTNGGGTLLSGGCINCLPSVYGGFYQCGFCDASAIPENRESCNSFQVGSEWLMCEKPSGDTCNVQFCSWSGLEAINSCSTTC